MKWILKNENWYPVVESESCHLCLSFELDSLNVAHGLELNSLHDKWVRNRKATWLICVTESLGDKPAATRLLLTAALVNIKAHLLHQMSLSLFPGSQVRAVASQSGWRRMAKKKKSKSLSFNSKKRKKNILKMCLHSKVNYASVACCLPPVGQPLLLSPPPPPALPLLLPLPSPITTEITIDWWSRTVVVCTCALQSLPTNLFLSEKFRSNKKDDAI